MISLVKSVLAGSPGLSLDDFEPDEPFSPDAANADAEPDADVIDGVTLRARPVHSDARGSLCELLTTRGEPIEPIVHVYQVTANPGSIRAWIYHRRQHDRLAFVNGRFRIALYDIRPGSPTFGMLNVFVLGRDQPSLLRIPSYVIHGVQNLGRETATFVNMPTKAYEPMRPDKCRLPADDPRIPFSFDD